MALLHTKEFRALKDAFAQKGLEIVSGDVGGRNGKMRLVVRYGKYEAQLFASPHARSERDTQNTIRDARQALRAKGADFSIIEAAEKAQAEKNATAPVREVSRVVQVTYRRTRLTKQEKADYYMLVKSGTDVQEALDAYRIHRRTGDAIMLMGLTGELDEFLSDEYKSKTIQPEPTRANPVGTATIAPKEPAIVPDPVTRILDPTPEPEARTERPKTKLGPFDPRVLALAAEVAEVQNRLDALSSKAAELGIVIEHNLDVHWQ